MEGFIQKLINKIGKNTDTAGSTTVFARLAQIAGFTDTLEASIASFGGGVKLVQRGTSASAGTATITPVVVSKSFILSKSKGSAGYVAARGSIALTPTGGITTKTGGEVGGSTAGSFPSYSGSITGGTTDLTVKEFSAVLTNTTTVTFDGACEWQVIEFN